MRSRDALTTLAIRSAYWTGAALALLWAPVAGLDLPFGAYEARTDLLFGVFEQWDAGWFLRIAAHGYDIPATSAYFPVYPLLVRGGSYVLHSHLVAAVVLALAAGCVGVAIVAGLARRLAGEEAGRDTLLLLALYPLAFVFTAAYSDGLYLALAAGSLALALDRRPLPAGVAAALALGTRSFGAALLPALALIYWRQGWRGRAAWQPVVSLLLVPLALVAYAVHLDRRFGNPFEFSHAESTVWLRHRPALGPLGGLWDSVSSAWHGAAQLALHLPRLHGGSRPYGKPEQWALWNITNMILLAAALALAVVAWRRLGPPLGLYSVGVIAIVLTNPADVVPLVSFPRYLLSDFPLFVALALVLRPRPRARVAALVAFGALGAVAAVAFSRHVWVA